LKRQDLEQRELRAKVLKQKALKPEELRSNLRGVRRRPGGDSLGPGIR
jgi:hypothetical protein